MSHECQYQYRQDHIHEIIFLASSRDVVDEWVSYLDIIYAYGEKSPLLLFDFSRSGLPPIGYFLTRLRQWQQNNPHARLGRCAIVYEGNAMLLLLLKNTTIVTGLAISRRTRFFNSHAHAQAIEWLQANQAVAVAN